MDKLKEKHGRYLQVIWNISLFIGGIWALLEWLGKLFSQAQQGNILGFIFFFILQSVLMGLYTLFYAVVVFLVLVVSSVIPYLLYRGFTK